ncbi:MAG TPA: 3-mercaptopyruvate sulfurtransferase [Polyangium sp.]|nr:3-mercaptopyruvate sulfurtransferase [Polyangium sp.]
MDPIVSTEWLAAEIGKPDLVIFDATKFLPHENRDGRNEFLGAHLPGARFFDIDEVADQDTHLPHMVPTAGRFEKCMAKLGVTNASRVVFYDQKGLASAARGYWLLGLFGHDAVAVLDGGLPKWRKEGRSIESGEPKPAEATAFVAAFRAQRIRGVGDLLANLESKSELVVDARPAGRFTGAQPEPRKGVRAGHIPSAVNLPYTELLGPDGTFLPIDALRERFAKAGVDGNRAVITSCGTGVTACILSLGMQIAGLPAAPVYDGSWTEWGSRSDTPIETG